MVRYERDAKRCSNAGSTPFVTFYLTCSMLIFLLLRSLKKKEHSDLHLQESTRLLFDEAGRPTWTDPAQPENPPQPSAEVERTSSLDKRLESDITGPSPVPPPPPFSTSQSYYFYKWATLLFVIFVASNYSYIRSLNTLSPSVTTALFSTNPAFVYVLERLALKAPHSGVKMLAVFVACLGVTLTVLGNADAGDVGASSSSISTPSTQELAAAYFLILFSSLTSGLYKIVFFRRFSGYTTDDVAQVLGFVGLVNFTTMWLPLTLMVLYTSSETLTFTPTFFKAQASHASSSLAFNFISNWGLMKTSPLFLALAVMVGIPMTVVYDCGFSGEACALRRWESVAGIGCIIVSFGMVAFKGERGGGSGRGKEKESPGFG